MNIYGCINRQNCALQTRKLASAAIRSGTIGCVAPEVTLASVASSRRFSEKIAELVATPTPTVPCALMYTIHFASAIMHEDPLMRLSRGAR
jgi:hypothetical protein